MSKKKFTDGLESVFDSSENESGSMMATVLQETRQQEERIIKAARKGGKNFSSDIDDVIMNSFVTNHTEVSNNDDYNDFHYSNKKAQRRPLNGLEALLTRTMDYGDLDNDTKRRIVLILEQHKVTRLQEIAKEEQLFLKDIILKSVSFYIDQYDKRK